MEDSSNPMKAAFTAWMVCMDMCIWCPIADLLQFFASRVLVRRLQGGGVHDDDELVAIPADALDGLMTTAADENEYEGDPWALDRELAAHDGVITQSVTLASEAVLLGTPTLLVSRSRARFS